MQNHQHQHLKIHSLSCQAPTKQPIQVVSGSKEYWFHKTARRTYHQEEFFINNPSPHEREVPLGYNRSRHGLARQVNGYKSKKFKLYIQLISVLSEFGDKVIYASREFYAKKLGVGVGTITKWDNFLVSLGLIDVRYRPGHRTNQKKVFKGFRDNRFLALLDGVSIRYKKVINNSTPNPPLSITYGKDINISLELENKRLRIPTCAQTRDLRKENSQKREELERKKEVLLREPQNKWMNYYFNEETHTLPVNLKEVRSWMVLAASVRVPIATARALCDTPPRMFNNVDRMRLCQFSPHVLRRAIADLNASEYMRVDSYAVLCALCMFYSADMELPRNLKFTKIANWVSDNYVGIRPRSVRDEFAECSPFWYYSRSLRWLQLQIKIISTWKSQTEQKGYEIPIAGVVLKQLEDYEEWAMMSIKPRQQEERSYVIEREFYAARMRDLTEGHVTEEERCEIRNSIQEWLDINSAQA